MSNMKVGDVVMFKDGLYEDEVGEEYTILEINGDRCILKDRIGFTFEGTSVAMLDELVLVEKEA